MRSGFRFLVVPLAVLETALSSSGATRAQFERTVATTSPYCAPWTLSFGRSDSGTGGAHLRFSGAAGRDRVLGMLCRPGSRSDLHAGHGRQRHRPGARRRRSQTGNYAISVQRLNDPVGCSALAFDASTRTGAIVAGETECLRFTGAAGHRVRLRLVTPAATLSPLAEVLRPDGTTHCAPNGAENQTCVLDTSGTHTILVRDVAANVGGYSLAVQRLNDPVGCTLKPYATTAAVGVVTTTGETDCWRFGATAGQRVRIRAVKTSGALDPVVEVLRPSGTTRCTATTTDDVTCPLDVTGTHTILVHDFGGTATGDYRLGLQRLTDPVGCSPLSYGTTVTDASLASTVQTDCWRFTGGAGDRVRLRVVGTTGVWSPVAEVLDASGRTVCNRG
jgi:hypothetical protein